LILIAYVRSPHCGYAAKHPITATTGGTSGVEIGG